MQPENINEYFSHLFSLLKQQAISGEWWQYILAFIGVLIVAVIVTYIILFFIQYVTALIITVILALAAWCSVELTNLGLEWYQAVGVSGLVAAILSIPFLYSMRLAELVRERLW